MYLSNCYPVPVFLCEDETCAYRFGAEQTMLLSAPITEGIGRRMRALWHRFTCTAGTLELAASYALRHDNGSEITAALGDCPPDALPLEGMRYTICADIGGVTLCAADEKALMEGFCTLVQMIVPENLGVGEEAFYIAKTEVRDRAAMDFRCVHLCIFPDSVMSTLEKAIHMAGFLKLTHIVLEFWGVYPYECLPLLAWQDKEHSFTRAEIESLVALAHSYGMEVIPMINHFGHASNSRGGYGRHTLLNADLRYSLLYEPDGWTWCLSNPDTKKLLSEMRAELYDICGEGKYFHLGFDEAYSSFASCPKCRKRIPHELLAEFINELTDDICSHGRRPIIWHDELLSAHDFSDSSVKPVANGHNQNTYRALDLLDRRVIIADWEYSYKNGENVSTQVFLDRGFDVILCPWDNHENIRSLSQNVKQMGAMGLMLTTWHHLPGFLPGFPYAA
ncbi:MAG: family 20 glycosylhydrolase, partial [Clostridia bacterium]|nr:family 20 glycosylhydrolase [Clostridia bacterium]